MKKILGLDLGTTSIGWALVNEKETAQEESSIIKLGVRVVPLTTDEQQQFEKGVSITTNADRTLKRHARRNLQRYKLRREHLIETLKEQGWIDDDTILAENGNRTTFETYRLRAKAATEQISLVELARVLLTINKKRGYKSSRKANNSEDGQLIDGMAIAMELYNNNLTPGQYMLGLLDSGKRRMPDFYRSDLQAEFDRVWDKQKEYYPDLLTDDLREKLKDKNSNATWAILKEPLGLVGIKRDTKRGAEQNKENCQWRCQALTQKMGLEELAVVLQEINKQKSQSSGYLGAISDRSKELYFNHLTIGQYQMAQLDRDPHFSLRNQVYYRQDYMDEFDTIWDTQARFHPQLTPELKHDIRDIIIFYQRPLRSQKGLIDYCELESRKIEVTVDGKTRTKTTGPRVCPKSSPLFQESRIWQTLNVIEITDNDGCKVEFSLDHKQLVAQELMVKPKLTDKEVLSILGLKPKDYSINIKEIVGHRTNAALFSAYGKMLETTGHDEVDLSKLSADRAFNTVESIFRALGINTDILYFDTTIEGEALYQQPAYQLWHLLYSYGGDNSNTGNASLIDKLQERYGFDHDCAAILANVTFEDSYGNLSSKALNNILPWLKEGYDYYAACSQAGYNHSHSTTKEENEKRQLQDHIQLLAKGALRNPVVEKILNQTINVVNQIIDTYGRPDEIRIEMARELKKTAKQRDDMTKAIGKTTKENEVRIQRLKEEFGIPNPSRNDILRLRLYDELAPIGYKAPYSGRAISPSILFSKEIDIEHIIPQARMFDDSFANKTLEFRSFNLEKSNMTAFDYVEQKWGDEGVAAYKDRVAQMDCSPVKKKHLLWRERDIPDGFLNRDLTNSQYIARKATELLLQAVRYVHPTVGSITDRLRDDWQLTDVMRELNWDKYERQGLTYIEDRGDHQVPRIKDWTKRNDHRHHAMDALTIAFTKRSIVQYLNNLNARRDDLRSADDFANIDDIDLSKISPEERSAIVYAIQNKEMEKDKHGKLRFRTPFGTTAQFRAEAKRHLEAVIVSHKAKNKVGTLNANTTRVKHGKRTRIQVTPRGQLHKETFYGSIQRYATKEEKVGSAFDEAKIMTVANAAYRKALLARLQVFGGDPKKAFTGANSLEKKPIFLNIEKSRCVPPRVKTVTLETVYTIRENVTPKLNLEKVVDSKVRRILEARLKEYGGDATKAFSDLDENPIWLNEEKGIAIKSVITIEANKAIAIHKRYDHTGKLILDEQGNPLPKDFVDTSNNHHVAIFRDANGELQEHIVSFYETVARKAEGLPVIDKEYKKDEGWQFLFTMKKNEFFVFPNPQTGFLPEEVDLLDPKNAELISPNIFKVQKFSTKYYVFRHHLETMLNDSNSLRDTTWKRITNLKILEGVVKVRVDHLGRIVQVGDYD